MKQPIIRHITAFLLSVLLAVGFLLLGACIPQAPIDSNVRSSAEAMIREDVYPQMADHSFASTLDYITDALILAESQVTTISAPETIFTNPLFDYGEESAAQNLLLYNLDQNPQPTRFYVQYWMGFRSVIRLLLSFLDYYQILRYTALLFFVLMAAVICSVASHAGTKAAFFFALSLILVRPHVIAVSLQFSCCFFIAFLAMLAVPGLKNRENLYSLFFLEFGILTQYFDFYTTPVLTFVLPMTYLWLLKNRDGNPLRLKQIGASILSWCAGYGLMWLAKLVLTSLFTEVDALGQGFASFSGRIGIEKVSGMEDYYSPIASVRSVFVSLYSDREGKLILLAACAAAFVLLVYRFLREKHRIRELGQHWQLLLLAALPVVWFIAAAQPTANHHWFQYRGIAGSFWAGFLYLQLLLQRHPDSLPPQ